MTADVRPSQRASAAGLRTKSNARISVRARDLIVVTAACAGGIGAALADAAPTGVGWWDTVLRFGFATLVALACSRARRWTWFLLLGLGIGFASSVAWALVSAVALAVAFARAFDRRRSRPAGAVIGALGMQSIVRLGPIGFFGLPGLIALVATGPVLWVGYQFSNRVVRRWVRRGALGVAIGVVVLGTIALVGVMQARAEAERGVSAARAGLEAARDGNQDAAINRLSAAEAALDNANGTLDSMWMRPTRLLPVVSQHVHTLERLTAVGAAVSHTAATAATAADVDELKVAGGQLDLNLVASMKLPLDDLTDTLETARVDIDEADSPWLLPPVEARIDDLSDEIDEALPDAHKAAGATALVPGLLGGEGTRRYLVLFGTPAEARELGGIVGNYIELEAAAGKVSIVTSGRATELVRVGPSTLPDKASYPARFTINDPEKFSQNWTGMPDFPSVARASADMYESLTGTAIDGVMYLDPYGLAALLEFTGPIRVAGVDFPITSHNAAELLLVDQYRQFPVQAQRVDFLSDIADAAFAELLRADLPGPRRVGDVLGPVARAGRMQFTTFDADEADFLASVFLEGAFPDPEAGDFLSVVHANGAPNKLDTFLTRTVNYDIALDAETGGVDGVVEVSLSNDAPDDLPDYVYGPATAVDGPVGTNRVQLSVYTPHALTSLTVDGEPVEAEPQQEFGLERYLVFVSVEPGEVAFVRFELTGAVDLSAGEYRLTLANQPVVNDDDVRVRVSPTNGTFSAAEGFELNGGGAAANFTLVEDVVLTATIR